ncbi:stage II sporulation protein P [Clostridium lacusfryxellense]|uniref:stage II sporulation protein P n=1 Tax=Clostridium lacusfryxellense TaxID=205328 RepID=UPI001C0B5A1F|nr:stage II sporulation protein P [Clostridium lacusfryxellense]MBU3114512.1 stage II sporulation protein P [Clostridium lacusfryxellense]
MRQNGIKKNSCWKLYLSVSTFIIIFLLSVILPKSVSADNNKKSQNYFYVNVITNVLAVIKSSNNKEERTNSKKDITIPVLSFLGIDLLNPISIIKKEIAYLDNNEGIDNESNGVEKRKTIVLNPFILDDKQVSKSEDKVKDTNAIANLYNPKLKQTLNSSKPRVLIYHSHTTEAYLTSDKDKSKNTFNMDLTQGVCEVGDVIVKDLKKYGIVAINDDTIHNVGDYNASYKKSRITLTKYLKEYGDFDIIIDLHRDGVLGDRKNETTKINGVDVAKVMFVMTKLNPRYAAQKKLVTSMIGISNELYPGLMDTRQVYLYNRGMSYYSQDISDNAMLVEVGNNNSTITEAKNTGLFLSRVIAEQLNGKK